MLCLSRFWRSRPVSVFDNKTCAHQESAREDVLTGSVFLLSVYRRVLKLAAIALFSHFTLRAFFVVESVKVAVLIELAS